MQNMNQSIPDTEMITGIMSDETQQQLNLKEVPNTLKFTIDSEEELFIEISPVLKSYINSTFMPPI